MITRENPKHLLNFNISKIDREIRAIWWLISMTANPFMEFHMRCMSCHNTKSPYEHMKQKPINMSNMSQMKPQTNPMNYFTLYILHICQVFAYKCLLHSPMKFLLSAKTKPKCCIIPMIVVMLCHRNPLQVTENSLLKWIGIAKKKFASATLKNAIRKFLERKLASKSVFKLIVYCIL